LNSWTATPIGQLSRELCITANPTSLSTSDNATKSTIKSNSSKGGQGFNEIRFEDKKGSEQVFLHAEKDQDIRVKEVTKEWIGKDRHLIVKENQRELVEKDKHAHVKGDQLLKSKATTAGTIREKRSRQNFRQ
jgi:type VI secretion system secreted protein VgrG